MRNVLRIACSACLGGVLFAVTASSAAAQSHRTPPASPSPVMPDASNNTTSPPPVFANTAPADASQTHMMREMAKERSVLRQKEILDETNQLLDLAKQLKDAVEKSNRDQLSLDVVNKAGEIEKLAKSVKQKMRDGD